MKSITLSLLKTRILYEKHIKNPMPANMPYYRALEELVKKFGADNLVIMKYQMKGERK